VDRMPITNPYSQHGVKRTERPWESREPVRDADLSADPFDCGIDWDAAARQADAAVSKRTDIQESHQGQSNQKSVLRDVKKPDPNRNALAALRPASWKEEPKKVAPPPKPSLPYNDPAQEGLPPPLQFDPATVQRVEDSHRRLLIKNAELDVPLLNGWTLYNHQKQAILRSLSMRRQILALDMGLGKTLIGCVWAKAFCESMPVVVVVICPASLQQDWKRAMTEAVGLKVSASSASELEDEGCQAVEQGGRVFIASWGKIPSKVSNSEQYIVIADEAHSMQSMDAARTKRVLSLTKPKGCKGVLLLSGTPMKNGRPSNLFPLLKAVKHPLGRHQRAYEAYFCQGRETFLGGGRSIWRATGSANTKQLQSLTQTHMLHLTKEKCLKDLPKQTRVFRKVAVSSKFQQSHNEALRKLDKAYNTRTNDQDPATLTALTSLRAVGALSKVDAAVQVAAGVLEEEAAVVIFTHFVQAAKNIHKQMEERGWAGELYTGETPVKKRDAMVTRFQNGLSSVFVCTFGAAGVGLTLTSAHTIILVDRPWTPGDTFQAEDRVRRIGQTKPVKSIWLSSSHVDDCIDKLLEKKSQTASSVLTGSAVDTEKPTGSLIPLILKALCSTSSSQQTKLDFSQPTV